MNFAFKIAWRYLRSRRQSLARFTSGVAVVGIAAGVASLILAQALARGFRAEMQDKILANTAHVSIFRGDGGEISGWREIKKKLENFGEVAAVSPTTYESVLIAGEKTTSYAVLRLTENYSRDEKQEAKNGMNPQPAARRSQSIEISLGAELAEKIGVSSGGEAKIILPLENNFAAQNVSVHVRETFRTGLYDYDSTWIRISPENLKLLYNEPDFTPSILNVSVRNIDDADKTAQKIREILPPDFKVLDWQEANRPLFAALNLERKTALLIISLIVFVAVLNITTTLALLVGERRLDIAILRTCGAKTKSLILIFLLEGVFLGSTGIVCGAVLGATLCVAGNYFRFVSLPADVYSLSYVPLNFSFGDVFSTAAVAFVASLSASVYPAWRAARIKPLVNLRQS